MQCRQCLHDPRDVTASRADAVDPAADYTAGYADGLADVTPD
jgi:hypothetical protein